MIFTFRAVPFCKRRCFLENKIRRARRQPTGKIFQIRRRTKQVHFVIGKVRSTGSADFNFQPVEIYTYEI